MIKGKNTLLRAIEKKDLKVLMKWRNNPNFRVFFREHREINFHNQTTWFNEFVKKKIERICFLLLRVRQIN